MRKSLIFLFMSVPLCWMNLAFAQDFIINSNPEEAEIYVRDTVEKSFIKVGKTPFKGSLEQITSNIAKGRNFIIELRKEGFSPYRVLMNNTLKVRVELAINMDIAREIEMVKDVDLMISQLFEAQRLVRNKDYGSAMNLLNRLETAHPHFSSIYEMKGGIFYLQKDFNKSLSQYRKAFSLNPDNRDSFNMKQYLEAKLTGKGR